MATSRITLSIENHMVMGMVVMDDTLWVVQHSINRLTAIQLDGNKPLETSKPQILGIEPFFDEGYHTCKPQGMVRYPLNEDQLVISDYENSKLWWVRVAWNDDGQWDIISTRTTDTPPECEKPRAISLIQGKLIISDRNTIHCVDNKGRIRPNQYLGQPDIIWPYKVILDEIGMDLVVYDMFKKTTYLVSRDSYVLGIIQQDSDPSMYTRNDIADGVYVTDYEKNSVTRFWKTEEPVITSGFNHPHQLCQHEGVLYVAHKKVKRPEEIYHPKNRWITDSPLEILMIDKSKDASK